METEGFDNDIFSCLETDEKKALVKNTIDENMKSFDEILEKIGFGKYQLKIYAFIGFICFSEGSQISVLTLLIPVISSTWNVDQDTNSFQASLIFISILFGIFKIKCIILKKLRKVNILLFFYYTIYLKK